MVSVPPPLAAPALLMCWICWVAVLAQLDSRRCRPIGLKLHTCLAPEAISACTAPLSYLHWRTAVLPFHNLECCQSGLQLAVLRPKQSCLLALQALPVVSACYESQCCLQSLVDVWAATPECWLLALQAPAVSHSGAFDDLLGGPTPSAASPSFPNIVAWQKDGITVTFSFSKPAGHPEVTQIEGSYSNTSDTAISDFSLQVRLWLSSSTSAAAQQADAHTLG